MTQPLTQLDAAEFTRWLTHLTQAIDRNLREPARSTAAALLREGLDASDKLGVPVLDPARLAVRLPARGAPRDLSMMQTVQLAEGEVAELAKATRPAAAAPISRRSG